MTRNDNDALPDIKPTPGEYRCRWQLPVDFGTAHATTPVPTSTETLPAKPRRWWSWWRSNKDIVGDELAPPAEHGPDITHRTFNGSVDLRPGISPRGEIFDWSPSLELVDGLSMEMAVSFPQTFRLDVLRGTIEDAGYEMCLLGAVLTAWAPDRIAVTADAALVGAKMPSEEPMLFQSAEFQVSGLDAIGGFTPLLGTKHPPGGSNPRGGEWRATGNVGCTQTWSDAEAEVTHDYNIKFQAYDPYYFRIAFSPIVRVTLTNPLPLRQWLDCWVIPIRRIVCVATNREESITSLVLHPTTESEHSAWSRLQVFGSGISQEPFSSRRDAVHEARSAFTLAADNLNLLQMVRSWVEQINDQNPLMETYDPALLRRNQPPRSRFLVLVQALEGLAGYQTRDTFEARQKKHLADRDRVMSRLRVLVDDVAIEFDKTDLAFVKKRLPKRPPGGLDEALRMLFAEVHAEHLLTVLSEAQLITHVINDYAQQNGDTISVDRALAIIRNDLSHGNRSYPHSELTQVSNVLERVARAHMLRVIGCGGAALARAIDPA